MNQALAATSTEDVSFEQLLFLRSPVGTTATTALLFVVLTGSFALASAFVHAPLFGNNLRDLGFTPDAWPALVLSLLTATILGMQRYTYLKEQTEKPAFMAIASGAAAAATIVGPAPRTPMLWASAAGAAAGIALAFVAVPLSSLWEHPVLFAWKVAIIMFLCALFARGVVSTVRGGRAFAQLIEHDLKIDLLQVDKLAVIGRRSARNAFVWFTASAIVCLFFVGDGIGSTNFAILGACVGMGLWIFFRPMTHVHRRIRAEKSAALDRIRTDIGAVRGEAACDAKAAMRLQGLLAYETRIQTVHEWPFDHSTLVRVAGYVLIPALPWIGRALAGNATQFLPH
jgi:hypothetical protein